VADNATAIRGMYEAFARGDVPAVLGALHEQVEWNQAEHVTYWPGGAFTDPQAVVAGVFARIIEDLPDFSIDVRRIVAAGDTVLVEARYRGTLERALA
jgi:uncharacterized protein